MLRCTSLLVSLLFLVSFASAGEGRKFDVHLGLGLGTLDGPAYDVDGKLEFNIGLDMIFDKSMWSLDYYGFSDDYRHQGTSTIYNKVDYSSIHIGYRRAYKSLLIGGSLGYSKTEETLQREPRTDFLNEDGVNRPLEIGLFLGVQLHRNWSVNLNYRVQGGKGGNQGDFNPDTYEMARIQAQFRFRASPAKAIF